MNYQPGGVSGKLGEMLVVQVPIAGKPRPAPAPANAKAAPAPSGAPEPQIESNDVSLELADPGGKAMAGVAWKVVLPNGKEKTGKTAADGKIFVSNTGPGGDFKLLLPDLDAGAPAPSKSGGPGQQAPPPQSDPPPQAARQEQLDIEAVDAKGQPAANVAWELTLPDGSTRKGKTGADGKISLQDIPAAGDCKLVFPAFEGTQKD